MNYATASAKLTGRCRERRKMENNTYLVRRIDGGIAVRLHNTDVLLFRPNGSIVLNSGRWRTTTTKDRMNR